MNKKCFYYVVVAVIFLNTSVASADPYKICATIQYINSCEKLSKGDTEVHCEFVQDSVECAQKLMNNTADFGFFSAESLLHLALLEWQDISVILQMRHSNRINQNVDFQSVVLVKSDHTQGISGLRGKKFCHPGLYYDKTHRWSERFLKHFERTVVPFNCSASTSSAEIEAASLNNFFGKSCRPGLWSHDLKEDKDLKKKYPKLCSLCNNRDSCSYPSDDFLNANLNNHQQALRCITETSGEVAYLSLEDVKKFFKKNPSIAKDYKYLCSNGALQDINQNGTTCVWLTQAWPVILAQSAKSVPLSQSIRDWLSLEIIKPWLNALKEILNADTYSPRPTLVQSPKEYIQMFREIPHENEFCSNSISWCTTSLEEKEKCKVISKGGISTGIFPIIECKNPTQNTVNCIINLNENKSDFVGIDSNYGFLARSLFNLTSALYFETDIHHYSSVVVAVHINSKFQTFESLKGAKACLPEFGSTPSMAFINLGKSRGFFSRNECRYGHLLHKFFGDSCAPGASDIHHDRNKNNPESLCALCKIKIFNETNNIEGNIVKKEVISRASFFPSILPGQGACAADYSNIYYGNKGALRCLHDVGDVAILELQSIQEQVKEFNLNENDYRIICRNGSLAQHTGFNVDIECALTTIVDGEIVVRRGSNRTAGIVNVLTALDTYFQNDPDFRMYSIYRGEKDLLFKDSTIGVIAYNEENFGPAVKNYIKLFDDLEKCVQGNSAIAVSLNMFTVLITSVLIVYQVFY